MTLASWAECAPQLNDAAMDRTSPDTVIKGGNRWVYSGEIIPGTDIAIKAGRIAYVGPDARHAIGDAIRVI